MRLILNVHTEIRISLRQDLCYSHYAYIKLCTLIDFIP